MTTIERKTLWVIGLIAVGLSIVGVSLSAYNYFSVEKSPTSQQVRLLAVQLNMQKIQTLVMQQRLARLGAALPLESQKTAAEVSYLVTIANTALTINHDPAAALEALKNAQGLLGVSNDARWMGLSAAIQTDREILSKATQVDTSQLFSTLSGVIDNIQPLSNVPAKPVFPTVDHTAAPVTSTGWHQKYLDYLARLKNLVIVRHSDQDRVPLVSMEAEAMIKQNITTQLMIAQTALLNKNEAVYKMALQNAQKWLMQYFPSTTEREAVNTALLQLISADISPSLPSLTNTMNALALINNSSVGA